MNHAIFRCCPTSLFLKQYERATDAVLKKLDIGFAEIKAFNCCGYPLKNINFKAYLLSSARNLSLCEQKHLHLITVCSCCYGSLKQAQHVLNDCEPLKDEVNATLEKEGLHYTGSVEIKHLFTVLHDDIGVDRLQTQIKRPFQGLNIAAHYGCHLVRPREVTQMDSAQEPFILDRLIDVTGAKSIDWPNKDECCGSPLWGIYDELSMDLTQNKIERAGKSGADYLCVTCVYCQLQFDRAQQRLITERAFKTPLPSILYPQLLGLGLGIESDDLGIHENRLELSGILSYCS